jgi:hypothetical protein
MWRKVPRAGPESVFSWSGVPLVDSNNVIIGVSA